MININYIKEIQLHDELFEFNTQIIMVKSCAFSGIKCLLYARYTFFDDINKSLSNKKVPQDKLFLRREYCKGFM